MIIEDGEIIDEICYYIANHFNCPVAYNNRRSRYMTPPHMLHKPNSNIGVKEFLLRDQVKLDQLHYINLTF